MAVLHWGRGPHRLGCVYHQQGVCRFGDDAVIADVFVMPKIIKVRPIAITIGRYRKSKAIAKQKWQLRDPKALAGVGAKRQKCLRRLVSAKTSRRILATTLKNCLLASQS